MKERKILERKFTFVWDIPLFHVEQPVAGLGWTGSQSLRSHVEQPVAGLGWTGSQSLRSHVEQPVAGLGWTGSQSFRSHVEQPVAGLVRTYYRDSSLNNFSFFIKKNIEVVFFLY